MDQLHPSPCCLSKLEILPTFLLQTKSSLLSCTRAPCSRGTGLGKEVLCERLFLRRCSIYTGSLNSERSSLQTTVMIAPKSSLVGQ